MPSPQEIPVLLTLTSQLTPPPHPSAAKRVAGPLYRFVKGRKVSAFINENFDALQREASWVRRSHAPWIREKLERLQPLARGEATDRLQALFNAVNPETAPNVPPCTLGGVMLASYLERAIVEQELEEWTHQHRSKLASRKAFFKSARRAYRNDSCSFDATPIRNESELPGVLHRYTALQTVTLADGRSLEWQPMSPEPTGLPESTPMSFAKNLWNFRSKAQKHEKGEFDLDYLLKFGAANSLSETERTNLTDWIARIKEIWEYIRFGPRLCHAVCEILQDVCRH
ncbi:MAG: hypothetical protein KDK78_06430, partial [Chlamydiia bacterium]|nr:hypothetical protein [Chlamydiia bacterium]